MCIVINKSLSLRLDSWLSLSYRYVLHAWSESVSETASKTENLCFFLNEKLAVIEVIKIYVLRTDLCCCDFSNQYDIIHTISIVFFIHSVSRFTKTEGSKCLIYARPVHSATHGYSIGFMLATPSLLLLRYRFLMTSSVLSLLNDRACMSQMAVTHSLRLLQRYPLIALNQASQKGFFKHCRARIIQAAATFEGCTDTDTRYSCKDSSARYFDNGATRPSSK